MGYRDRFWVTFTAAVLREVHTLFEGQMLERGRRVVLGQFYWLGGPLCEFCYLEGRSPSVNFDSPQKVGERRGHLNCCGKSAMAPCPPPLYLSDWEYCKPKRSKSRSCGTHQYWVQNRITKGASEISYGACSSQPCHTHAPADSYLKGDILQLSLLGTIRCPSKPGSETHITIHWSSSLLDRVHIQQPQKRGLRSPVYPEPPWSHSMA